MGIKITIEIECDKKDCQTKSVQEVKDERVYKKLRALEEEGWKRKTQTWTCASCAKEELSWDEFLAVVKGRVETELSCAFEMEKAATNKLWRNYQKMYDLSVIDEFIENIKKQKEYEEIIGKLFEPFKESNELDLKLVVKSDSYGCASIALNTKEVIFHLEGVEKFCKRNLGSSNIELFEMFIKASTIHESGHYYVHLHQNEDEKRLNRLVENAANGLVEMEEYTRMFKALVLNIEEDAWEMGWEQYKRPWEVNEELYKVIKQTCLENYQNMNDRRAMAALKHYKKKTA